MDIKLLNCSVQNGQSVSDLPAIGWRTPGHLSRVTWRVLSPIGVLNVKYRQDLKTNIV